MFRGENGKNLYFLGGVDSSKGKERAADRDVKLKNYVYFDIDLRKSHPEMTDEGIKDSVGWFEELLESDDKFRNWRYMVYTGNGIHIYYFFDPISIYDKALWRLGMGQLIEELSALLGEAVDTSCVNAARIARMPGSQNLKSRPGKDVLILKHQERLAVFGKHIEELGAAKMEIMKQENERKEAKLKLMFPLAMDTYKAIQSLPVADVVCRTFGWEFNGKHFFEPGTKAKSACFVPENENFLVHGGTHHLPPTQVGFRPFEIVKEAKKIENGATFEWFRNQYPEIKEISQREKKDKEMHSIATATSCGSIDTIFEELKNLRFEVLTIGQEWDRLKFLIRGAVTRIGAYSNIGKCVSSNTKVMTPSGHKRIKDVQVGDEVFSLDEKHRMITSRVVCKQESGSKKVLKIKTRMGREIRVSPEHRIKVMEKWKTAAEVRVGDHVLSGKNFNFKVDGGLSVSDAKLLGYLIGDGSCTGSSFNVTTACPAIKEELFLIAKEKNWRINEKRKIGNKASTLWFASPDRKRPANAFPALHGLQGKNSHRKIIPISVFEASREAKWVFLNRLFACDGNVCSYKNHQVSIQYTSVSEDLIEDLQTLLLAEGIVSTKYRRKTSCLVRGEKVLGIAWSIDITGSHLVSFFSHGYIFGKEEKCKEAELRSRRLNRSKTDGIPKKCLAHLECRRYEIQRGLGKPRSRCNAGWTQNGRVVSRRLSSAIGVLTKDPILSEFLAADVVYDEVIGIESEPEELMFDIQIEKSNNFFANGILVHNSKLAYFFVDKLLKSGYRGILFSTEVQRPIVLANLLTVQSGVHFWDIMEERLIPDNVNRELYRHLEVYDVRQTMNELKCYEALIHKANESEKKVDFIIIDFCQNVRPTTYGQAEYQMMSNYAFEIQSLAQRLDIAVIDLSQISNEGVRDEFEKVGMIHFKGSGYLYSNADVGILLKREDKMDPNSIMSFEIRKHKYCPPETLKLQCNFGKGIFTVFGSEFDAQAPLIANALNKSEGGIV